MQMNNIFDKQQIPNHFLNNYFNVFLYLNIKDITPDLLRYFYDNLENENHNTFMQDLKTALKNNLYE